MYKATFSKQRAMSGLAWLSLVATFCFLSGQQAYAQAVLEEVIVTAQKRGEANLQSVPISVQAITGDSLEEAGALDFNDYFRSVPGLDVNDQGPGDKRYVVRGVNAVGAGTVGLYFDEVVITGENAQDGGGRQPDPRLYDLDRVEVLRGPQGTTFGSSSMAGTIRFLPNRPNLEAFEASVGVAAISTNDSDGIGYKVDGAINIPLAQNLGLRLAGLKLDKKGYIDNQYDDDGNNDDTESIRALLAWQPMDRLEVSVLIMQQESETDHRASYHERIHNISTNSKFNGESVSGKYRNVDFTLAGFEEEMDLLNFKLVYDADWGEITATVSKLERDSVFNRDSSAALEAFSMGAFDATTSGRAVITQPKDRELESREVRFASGWESPVSLLLGVFQSKEERFFRSAIFSADAATGKIAANPTTRLDRNVDTEIEEDAVFGEASWDINERLDLTVGFRWFDFQIKEVAESVTSIPGTPGTGVGPKFSFDEDGQIFKLNLAYHLTDDFMIYGQIAEGFRSGGTNDTTAAELANVTIPQGFESDELVNFELGLKSTLQDGRLILNASAYHIDWSNIQIQNQARNAAGVSFPYTGNGGEADVLGLEVELKALITDSLELSFAANTTSAELAEDLPIAADGQDGDDIPYVPDYTANANVRYEFPFLDNWTGFVAGSLSFTGESKTEQRPTSAFYRELDSYYLLSLRGGFMADKWSAVLSIDNVTDEDETTAVFWGFRGVSGVEPDGLIRPWPRTFSLSFRYNF